jgi:hypothetical protein
VPNPIFRKPSGGYAYRPMTALRACDAIASRLAPTAQKNPSSISRKCDKVLHLSGGLSIWRGLFVP